MRLWFCMLLTACCALAVAPAARGQTLLFDYVGFDFEDPNPIPGSFGEPGSGYQGVGLVPNLFAPLVFNHANFEYTYYFNNLTPVGTTVVGHFVIIDYSAPGSLEIFEDPKAGGTPGTYGSNPPNGTAPPSFVDGTMILSGELTNFRFVLNTNNNSGSFESEFEAVGGTQLGNLPLNQRTGWTFAGSTGNSTGIPPGYAHQIDGQTFLQKPSNNRASSWGRVKNLYR